MAQKIAGQRKFQTLNHKLSIDLAASHTLPWQCLSVLTS